MSTEKIFFDDQIKHLRSLSSIYQYLNDNASAMDASSLLRAEFVLAVSAFDNYIHNIVRRKIRENFFNSQLLPDDLCIPISEYHNIHNEPSRTTQEQLLDLALKKILEKDSFQSPRSVEYALNLINIKKVWSNVSPALADTPDNIKNRLALIVKRRNQIAHESDIDTMTMTPRSITPQVVEDCRDFLQKLISALDVIIT